MKFIPAKEASSFENSPQCRGKLYEIDDAELDLALIDINGRYPDAGEVVNTRCKELAYVKSGTGVVVINGQTFTLQKDDVVFIEPNEQYYWQGTLTVIITYRPRFDPAQHKLVPG